MNRYNVIGIMSGTSLDGLDVAYCTFECANDKNWSYEIHTATTIDFPSEIQKKLISAVQMSGLELMNLNNELGNFIGKSINEFVQNNHIDSADISCIASHGHTIFHQPEIQLTTQIGNGANISTITKLPVVCDFRTADVALGGQGAPLVPVGDALLFSQYDYCINLGGISNISFEENNHRIAFDICPVNIVLNKLSQEMGKTYDDQGAMAQAGSLNKQLLGELNDLDYYQKKHPKSLGIEWIEKEVFPILDKHNITSNDKLRTFVEHIAIQITNTITSNKKKVLLTGGGAFNTFLISRLKALTNAEVTIPSKQIVNYKEALIFAFLGVLRVRNEPNSLSSVTGSNQDNIGGCIYQSF